MVRSTRPNPMDDYALGRSTCSHHSLHQVIEELHSDSFSPIQVVWSNLVYGPVSMVTRAWDHHLVLTIIKELARLPSCDILPKVSPDLRSWSMVPTSGPEPKLSSNKPDYHIWSTYIVFGALIARPDPTHNQFKCIKGSVSYPSLSKDSTGCG